MNWYKRSVNAKKQELFGIATAIAAISIIFNIPKEKAKTEIYNNPSLIDYIPNTMIGIEQKDELKKEILDNKTTIKPVEQPINTVNKPTENNVSNNNNFQIDINKIIQIESSGNPNAVSPVGARGLTQIMKPTWEEITKKLNVNWSWDEAFDPQKNVAVGEYYFNKRIPQMLKHYNIPDSTESRIAAYNWGIGNLLKLYKNEPNNWIEKLPKETKNYINKYNNL